MIVALDLFFLGMTWVDLGSEYVWLPVYRLAVMSLYMTRSDSRSCSRSPIFSHFYVGSERMGPGAANPTMVTDMDGELSRLWSPP